MLVPILSFLGAMLGGAVPAFVALRGQRQDARGEWRQRLDKAIDLVSSQHLQARMIGDELLTALVDSDLGTSADHEVAQRIARVRIRES